MAKCEIISVSNIKGGTGKTTSTYNLGMALAMAGYKVLLVDNDPQGNLSTAFGISNTEQLDVTLHDVLTAIITDKDLPSRDQFIAHGERLDLIPSNINLSATEINLRDELGGERTLSTLLEPLREKYRYILIDTNPYLGLLTINALTACDSVLIPVSPQLWSAVGLTALLDIIIKVKKKINPRITVLGILMTMVHENTVLCREAIKLVEDYFQGKIRIFDTKIPMSTKVGEANFHSLSIMDFDAKNKAAIAYMDFAKEVIRMQKD